ncbi:MAG: type III PLP-dependent enzyme [Thermodesulfovibrionales bacterium]
MTRLFNIEKHHAGIVSKATMFKVLKYLDREEVRTPVLLLDRDKVREKAEAIGSRVRNSRVFYAVKANPDLETLRLMNSLGLGFEIASAGELRMLGLIGVEPGRIISSNPVKPRHFLEEASAYGVRYFAFDSAEEVDKMAAAAPGASVYIRLSVPNEGSEWPLSRKFGAEMDQAMGLIMRAAEKGLDVCGITFHVGSQCLNMFNWDTAIYKARALWETAEKEGVGMRILNIGGGYPIKYTKNVVSVENIDKNVDRLIRENFSPEVEVFIEPGRAMVGDAGVFVASVIGKARRVDEQWLYIDVGVFNGLMESLGGIRYSYLVEISGGRGPTVSYTVAGPSCDSFDVLDRDVPLPEPEVGSLVLIPSSGAYTVSYASEFNGFSIPKTILI